MSTLAWVLVLLGALVVRSASKGRGLSDLPGDLGDFFVAVLSGDMTGANGVLGRKGNVTTSVDVGTTVGLAGIGEVSGKTYKLGNVDPQLVGISELISSRFPVSNITGWRNTAGYGQEDHASGKSIDVFIPNKTAGDAIAGFLVNNARALNVKYVIWFQRIWYPGKGWQTMPDRGSDNANHKNHVHLTIN